MALSILRRFVNDGGEQESDGDGPLIETNDESSVLLGSTLRLVHWHEAGHHSNSQSGDDSANNERRELRVELKSDSQNEHDTGKDETEFPSESISERVGKKSPDEGSSTQDRDGQGFVRGGEVVASFSA